MGTPEFAVPSLDMLIKEGYQVAGVVTQPDRPKGRGKKLMAPPVKEFAQKHGIEVIQPVKVRTGDFAQQLRQLKPDLLITAAYGRILPKEVLEIPLLGCINVHASLLPKYRGAAPIQWAIINGEKTTGITTMYTDEGMDTGDMLLKREVDITEGMNCQELHDILSMMGAQVLKETLEKLKAGTLERQPQPHEEATYAPMIEKSIGLIDWKKSSREIYNLVRGIDPWPGAYTFYGSERMRVWNTVVESGNAHGAAPGEIIEVSRDGILAGTGDGVIRITEIQFDCCRRMSVESYLCGNEIKEGKILE